MSMSENSFSIGGVIGHDYDAVMKVEKAKKLEEQGLIMLSEAFAQNGEYRISGRYTENGIGKIDINSL